MALPAWLDGPIAFRPTVPAGPDPAAEGQGFLRAFGAPQPTPDAAPWVLRTAALFDPRASGFVADYFARPQAFVEMRLCAGPASEAEWEALALLGQRLRGIAPGGVLRLELWYGSAPPRAPEPGTVLRLRELRPLFVHAWVENEAHLTPAVQSAWARLIDGGVPVAAEILLRRGGSASSDALRSLCLKLLEWRVRPYMMVSADWLPAGERVDTGDALEWVRGLRGWISGLAVPQVVQESLQGVRTVHIPPYVTALDESGVEVVNYAGRVLRYPNPPKG